MMRGQKNIKFTSLCPPVRTFFYFPFRETHLNLCLNEDTCSIGVEKEPRGSIKLIFTVTQRAVS